MRRAKSLPHVKIVKAKGKKYAYFITGQKDARGRDVRVPLPTPGDPDFGTAYAALLAGRTRRANVAAQLMVPGLIDLYERSPEFRSLAPASRAMYGAYLSTIAQELNTAPACDVERRDVLRMRDKMGDRTGAANGMLRTMRALYAWGRIREHVAIDPCKDVPLFPSVDHEPWPDDLLIAALGDRDANIRLPVALLYFTAQRIGDVCKMRWSDIRDGRVHVKQQKTKRELEITVHRDLLVELEQAPKSAMTILADAKGRPAKVDTIRDRLQAWALARGQKVVPHGLRKNAVNALLEAGCSAAETAAVSGQSLKMVEHYAKRRSTRKLATAAILKMEAAKS